MTPKERLEAMIDIERVILQGVPRKLGFRDYYAVVQILKDVLGRHPTYQEVFDVMN